MVTLIDTSAWVEYLRASGSDAHHRLRRLVEDAAPIATTEVVVMETLAGARDAREFADLQRFIYGRCRFLPVESPSDWERAAQLYRRCRAAGETIRKLTDCLIAVVAMRVDAALLHRDRDFDAIARHAPLRVAP